MFYILHGKDSYLLAVYLKSLKQSLGNDDMLEMNTTLLDGKQLDERELIDTCSAVPFLSSHRLVIVEGLLGRFEDDPGSGRSRKKAQARDKKDVKQWQELANFIPMMPETTVLILTDGKLTDKNKLLGQLMPLATKIKSFPEKSTAQLKDWIIEEVKKNGTVISNEAIDLLVQLIGPDLWSMHSEIEKVITYKNGQTIEVDDIKELTCYAREENIFNLVDTIIAGQASKAEYLLNNTLKKGAAPSYILAMIARQFRLILMARELQGKISRQQLMQKVGIRSDYVFDRLVRQARLYDMEELKEAYNNILETDIAIKTGRFNEDLAIGILVAGLCRRIVRSR